jgi:hypothetical protein
MYNAMKKLIGRRFYADAAVAQEKLDVFFAVGRLTAEQYAELAALVGEVYAA